MVGARPGAGRRRGASPAPPADSTEVLLRRRATAMGSLRVGPAPRCAVDVAATKLAGLMVDAVSHVLGLGPDGLNGLGDSLDVMEPILSFEEGQGELCD